MKEKKLLARLYRQYTSTEPLDILPLPKSGSDRKYYRIADGRRSVIGVINPNHEENDTFVALSKHFRKKSLPVPQVFEYFPSEGVYFQTDLGDTNLYTWLERKRHLKGFDEEMQLIYRRALDRLIEFQVEGIKDLDLNICYPHRSFDEQSMMWDMNYFKYMFLKLVNVPFNEKRLEKDFSSLTSMLLEAGQEFFLYRDFQSANIMVTDGEPWFIDYQGGRGGAPQYDVASLLYDSKAHVAQQARELLLEHYIEGFCERSGYNETRFRELYPAFVLVRIMQALGAYGFRGLFEQKPGFVQSIIPAVRDINYLFDSSLLAERLPEIEHIVRAIPNTSKFEALREPETLRVKLSSFSYMNGLPHDAVHGGGYVYDCRGLLNPGKLPRFRNLTGNDREVGEYLSADPDTEGFINDAFRMVERSVNAYKKKNYTSLAVSFGCTGGKHRSVYSVNRIASMLEKIEGIDIEVTHRDIDS